jgi:predicted HD phosphohydrolase
MKFFIHILPFLLLANPFEELTDLYDRYGGEKYMLEEEIIQAEHVLQAAYNAERAGAPEDIVVALLYHDIGQICTVKDIGNTKALHPTHADRGGAWLKERGFSQRVCQFVRFHDLAKVILCSLEEPYYDHLSKASQISYVMQKEKYDSFPELVAAFMECVWMEEWLAARRCDDMAKVEGLTVPLFTHYEEMVARVLAGEGLPAKNADWMKTLASLQHSGW